MRKYFSVEQAGQEAHLYIFGDIVTERWSEEEVSSSSIQKEIAALDADVIHVHINSYGGSVSEGWAIYNTLRDHPARVVTHADGFVASAALYPFMAGDDRIVSNVSALFFHQVLQGAWGNADELRAAADEAEKLNNIGIAAFVNAGIDEALVLQLEKAETWVGPTEALEYGFATAIETVKQPKHSQSVKLHVMKMLLAEQHAPPSKTPGNSVKQMLAGYFNTNDEKE